VKLLIIQFSPTSCHFIFFASKYSLQHPDLSPLMSETTLITIWLWATDGCLTPRQIGGLTVGRNVTLTFAWNQPVFETSQLMG
jgi:hypothetical protein